MGGGGAEHEPVVLGKQVVVVRARTAVQHHDRRAVSDASRVDADAVQFDRRLVHRVSNYTVRVAMKLMRFPPALTPPGLRGLGLADVAILCLLAGAIPMVVAFAREFAA